MTDLDFWPTFLVLCADTCHIYFSGSLPTHGTRKSDPSPAWKPDSPTDQNLHTVETEAVSTEQDMPAFTQLQLTHRAGFRVDSIRHDVLCLGQVPQIQKLSYNINTRGITIDLIFADCQELEKMTEKLSSKLYIVS